LVVVAVAVTVPHEYVPQLTSHVPAVQLTVPQA
jgi:hypothetical protein